MLFWIHRAAGSARLTGLALACLLACWLVGTSCRTTPPRPVAGPGLRAEKLAEIDRAIEEAIAQKNLPGGTLWFEHRGQVYSKAYGSRALVPTPEPMTLDTIFDTASLTKVLATTTAIMMLVERGQVELEAPAARYVPEFVSHGKERITIRQLLTHTSGLRPALSPTKLGDGYSEGIARICAEPPSAPPDTEFRYGDINFMLLGEVVRRVTGQPLDEFAAKEIYRPLRMKDTGFRPAPALLARIAPTEQIGTNVLRGVVHDPVARRMGGVAGHAGVFSTVSDLARFSRMMLQGGELDGVRLLRRETVARMTSVQSPPRIATRHGLGWDIDSAYVGMRGRLFPVGSYGRSGWTGTSIWIDPFSESFVVFLSNRNHPNEDGNVVPLRSRIATLAAESIPDFNFAYVPGALARRETPPPAPKMARVLNGIDVLKRQQFAPLKGLRVGLITNHTGTDRERNSTIDLLHGAPDVKLAALFSPEHGIRGLLDEKVGDSVDEKTGLRVYSLYGEHRAPLPAQLAGLDALVFDIQDIGTRFYTYISTLGNCLEAGARAGKKFYVLDRVNPIGGVELEGPVLVGETSFTGWHPIPVRHGMTTGELARMFNAEKSIGAALTVIPVDNWERSMLFDQTGLPWINPSPNMRSLTEALLYPGIGLLETTALSVGRGTDTPFEIIGAPYIDDGKLALELNRLNLPGVRFVPIRFTPKSSVYSGKACGGVNIVVTDRSLLKPVRTGLAIAREIQRLYPAEFGVEKLNRLLAHPFTTDGIRRLTTLGDLERAWADDFKQFESRRKNFLLY